MPTFTYITIIIYPLTLQVVRQQFQTFPLHFQAILQRQAVRSRRKNFHLLNHFIYDKFSNRYLLVGCVGEGAEKNLERLDAQQIKQSDLLM